MGFDWLPASVNLEITSQVTTTSFTAVIVIIMMMMAGVAVSVVTVVDIYGLHKSIKD